MKSDRASVKVINQHGPLGFVAFTAFVGAFVYFLQDARHVGDILFAFIEAVVWPGIATYHALRLLGA